MKTSRRADMTQQCAAELAIGAAIDAVEKMAADPRLTDAVVLLSAAKASVADFVDGVEQRRTLIS